MFTCTPYNSKKMYEDLNEPDFNKNIHHLNNIITLRNIFAKENLMPNLMKKNYSRREFVRQNTIVALGAAALPYGFNIQNTNSSKIERIDNEIILHGRKNNIAWFEPAIGVIPGTKRKLPQVFVRATYLTGNDIGPQFFLKTDDLGKTWSNPVLCQNWVKVPMENDVFEEPWFGLFYHKQTEKFIAIGHTHFVQDAGQSTSFKNERHYTSPELKGSIVYSLWNHERSDFGPWERMILPQDLNLGIYYNGQFHEQDDGSILIPGYYISSQPAAGNQRPVRGVTILKCSFTGTDLRFIEHGSIHTIEEARGLAEPSLVCSEGKYYMTVRHDLRAYVTSGKDGLHYDELKTWRFDDGTDLGNYNTQQKWLKHNDTLYLVYNRKSELNNGVFRSRAPLFMAEVDTERLMVRKNTERIVFPEKGARMGNFNIAGITDNESWVITGEWLQGQFPNSKKGDRFWIDSNSINYIRYIGDLLLARVHWK